MHIPKHLSNLHRPQGRPDYSVRDRPAFFVVMGCEEPVFHHDAQPFYSTHHYFLESRLVAELGDHFSAGGEDLGVAGDSYAEDGAYRMRPLDVVCMDISHHISLPSLRTRKDHRKDQDRTGFRLTVGLYII